MIYLYEHINDLQHISTIDELMTILESGEYRYYGLRGATPENMQQIHRGYLDKSFDFDHELGVPSDEYLDGTCALGISEWLPENTIRQRFNNAKRLYCAAHGTDTVLLIAGDSSEYGEDVDEIIIRNGVRGADVIAIVDSI